MLVLAWWRVAFGVGVGAVGSTVGLWLAKERGRTTLFASGVGVAAGTALWNVMLNVRHARMIDGDIPFRAFPISWQDTGTGIFSFAFAALFLLATAHREVPGRHTLKVAGIAAAIAFLFDVYTW